MVEGLARIRIDRYTLVGYPYFEAEVCYFSETGLPPSAASGSLVQELKDMSSSLLSTFTALRIPLPALVTRRIRTCASDSVSIG